MMCHFFRSVPYATYFTLFVLYNNIIISFFSDLVFITTIVYFRTLQYSIFHLHSCISIGSKQKQIQNRMAIAILGVVWCACFRFFACCGFRNKPKPNQTNQTKPNQNDRFCNAFYK